MKTLYNRQAWYPYLCKGKHFIGQWLTECVHHHTIKAEVQYLVTLQSLKLESEISHPGTSVPGFWKALFRMTITAEVLASVEVWLFMKENFLRLAETIFLGMLNYFFFKVCTGLSVAVCFCQSSEDLKQSSRAQDVFISIILSTSFKDLSFLITQLRAETLPVFRGTQALKVWRILPPPIPPGTAAQSPLTNQGQECHPPLTAPVRTQQ